MINFYEFMIDYQGFYVYMVVAVMGYFLIQIILLIVSITSIEQKQFGEFSKYIRKIVNLQFLILVKVLSGPILGLAINVLYCA